MSSKNDDDQIVLTDDSDEEDLLSLSLRLSKSAKESKANPEPAPGAAASKQEDDDEDPDWVRDFSQPTEDKENRRRALTSVFDVDDDSLVDLTSDKEEPVEDKPEIEPVADGQAGDTKEADGKQKPAGKPGAKAQPRGSAVPKGSLPLVFAPKFDDNVVLIQGDDDALDLSGDVGAVGRVKIDDDKLFLDIKGVLYSTHTYPTNSMCLVSVGEDEARITTVLDEAVILTSERNILASEEVVAGTLDEDDANFSAADFSDDDVAPKEKAGGAKADKAAKSGKKKATPGRKPKAKTAASGGARKSISKTPRKKTTK